MAGVGAALGILAEWAYSRTGVSFADLLRDGSVGWAFIAAGLIARWRQPANRSGILMVATGITWFFGNFEDAGLPVLFSLAYWLEPLNQAVMVHLILSYPKGRLESASRRATVVVTYLLIGVVGLADMATYDPATDGPANYLCGGHCVTNALLLVRTPAAFTAIHRAYYVGGVLVAVAMVVLIARRWLAATGPGRRILTPVWVSTFIGMAVIGGDAVTAMGEQLPGTLGSALIWLSDLSQFAIPLAFLLGLLRMRLDRAAVGDLVIELGESPQPTRLGDALARTLRDPSLELAFWVPGVQGYVGPDGAAIQLPEVGTSRAVTLIEHRGHRHAAIVHDPALNGDGRLIEAVRAAARLGLENERLTAELRVHMEELRASRVRIVEAGDAERRRIERNLHDGAQQRLISVAVSLGLALEQARGQPAEDRQQLLMGRALHELRQALADIRELARGIHPAILSELGLAAAVTSLTERAPVPVVVRIPDHRYPSLIESTAYYVVSECVANAVRHARASCVEVLAYERDRWLVVEVADDGVGATEPRRGSGLQGLADRTATIGGTLQIQARLGGGTQVLARLPLR